MLTKRLANRSPSFCQTKRSVFGYLYIIRKVRAVDEKDMLLFFYRELLMTVYIMLESDHPEIAFLITLLGRSLFHGLM
jgi:hypothetical protein